MRFSGLLAALCFAIVTSALPPPDTGLIGLPAHSYNPVCATACLRCLYTMMLNCSNGGDMVGMIQLMTSTECYAQDTAYLTSVAWCAHTKCASRDPSPVLMEYWWDRQITGQKNALPIGSTAPPKWTYAEALSHASPPTVQLLPTDTMLNTTSAVPPESYEAQFNVLSSTQREGYVTNVYGCVQPESTIKT
jgi:hypothetical protein